MERTGELTRTGKKKWGFSKKDASAGKGGGHGSPARRAGGGDRKGEKEVG